MIPFKEGFGDGRSSLREGTGVWFYHILSCVCINRKVLAELPELPVAVRRQCPVRGRPALAQGFFRLPFPFILKALWYSVFSGSGAIPQVSGAGEERANLSLQVPFYFLCAVPIFYGIYVSTL